MSGADEAGASDISGLAGVPTERGHFRPDIEGLRAVAVLAVLVYHAGITAMPGGFVGVDVFYVISGFLITGLLLRELTTTGRVSLVRFYARRMRRLLPAALLVILVTLVASYWLLSTVRFPQVAGDAAAAAAYVSNYRFALNATDYLAAGSDPSPLLHYWSLSVEEQFYLVWPLLLIMSIRLLSRRGFGAVLIVVGAVSLAASIVWTDIAQPWAFFSLPTRAWELAVGGLLAITAAGIAARVPSAALAVSGLIGLGLIGASVVLINTSTPFPGVAAIFPVAGAALVILAGESRATPVARVLATSIPRWLGRISYSLYLWHWPLLILGPILVGRDDLATRLVIAALAIVVADLSNRWVETPIRDGRVLPLPPARSIAVAGTASLSVVLVAFAAGGGLTTGGSGGDGTAKAELPSLPPLRPRATSSPPSSAPAVVVTLPSFTPLASATGDLIGSTASPQPSVPGRASPATTPAPSSDATPPPTATNRPSDGIEASATPQWTGTSPPSTATREPSPAPTATATREPSPAPTATATREPSPAPTATATREPSPAPTATAVPEPSPAPTATAVPEPSPPLPSAVASEAPEPTPTAALPPLPDPLASGPVPDNLMPSLRNAADDLPVSYGDGCHLDFGTTQSPPCVYGDPASATTAILFGDSHAAQWLPALQRIAAANDWRLESLTKSGCPPVLLTVWNAPLNRPYRECNVWRQNTLKRIEAEHPAYLFVGAARDYQVVDDRGVHSFDASLGPWSDALTQLLARLHDAAGRVVLMAETPRFATDPVECLAQHQRVDPCTPLRTTVVDADYSQLEADAAASASVDLISANDWLCPGLGCPLVFGQYLVYRDTTHITATFMAVLAERLEWALGTLP